MDKYEKNLQKQLARWKKKMRKKPSVIDKTSKEIQNKYNALLPEKYHLFMTEAIKTMTRVVLLGSQYTTKMPQKGLDIRQRDYLAEEKMLAYCKIAMIEGAGTGVGGILLGLADFPLLLGIKIKFLYEIAAIYGFDTSDYKERLYILYIFQLAFSSAEKRNLLFEEMEHWRDYSNTLPKDINAFDWESFGQEYRDYLDLAKLLQFLPGIGAVVGAYVNNKLIKKLSSIAIYAYHMRLYNN